MAQLGPFPQPHPAVASDSGICLLVQTADLSFAVQLEAAVY